MRPPVICSRPKSSLNSAIGLQNSITAQLGALSTTAVLGAQKVEGPELVQETFRASAPPGDFETAWTQLLRDGFATHIALKEKPPTFNSNNAGGTDPFVAIMSAARKIGTLTRFDG